MKLQELQPLKQLEMLLKKPPQPFPQPSLLFKSNKITIIQIIEQQSLPPRWLPQPQSQSHPLPQFVAAKSLILKSSKKIFTLTVYGGRHVCVTKRFKKCLQKCLNRLQLILI